MNRPRVRLSEMDFQRQLVGPAGLATMLGWKHVHFRKARTEQGWRTPGSGELLKGWPDLVLVRERDGRLIFAELKADDGKPTPDQEAVLEVLRSLASDRVQVVVWRPRDFDAIVEELT